MLSNYQSLPKVANSHLVYNSISVTQFVPMRQQSDVTKQVILRTVAARERPKRVSMSRGSRVRVALLGLHFATTLIPVSGTRKKARYYHK